MNKFLLTGGLASAVLTTSSFGAVDVSSLTFDVTQVEALAALMASALALIWVARKIIGFIR